MLIETIIEHTLELMLDQYGNYVIQYVVSLGNFDVNMHITDAFKMDLINLCKQKFSSNVIEKVKFLVKKILEFSNQDIQENILKEITKNEVLISLLFDQFGNYVIQKALFVAKDPYFSTLINVNNS
jgi:pumilio RNA-binding family